MSSSADSDLLVEITVDLEVATPINESLLVRAVHATASDQNFEVGEIGIRVTSDPEIRVVNKKHLEHDYPTDVISFGYTNNAPSIQGEMVVSVDTARTRAHELGWSVDHELCLYVIHGTLHIMGMDDHEPEDRAEMREAEARVMQRLGITEIDRFAADAASTREQGE